MIKLLGVKDRGVYIVNDDKEELETILRFPGCLMMFFEENNKNEALRWAGVSRVSGFKRTETEETTESATSSKFLKTLENFRNKEYSYVEITLSNNEKFCIFLDDIVYLSTKVNLIYSSDKDELIVKNVESNFLPGDHLEHRINEYYDLCKTKLTIDECIRKYIKKYTELSTIPIAYSLKKPTILIEDNTITISDVFSKIEKSEEYGGYKIRDEHNDIMINESSIIMIKPFKFKYEIINKDIVMELKEFYPDL